jgi:hypothetical protein
VFNKKKMQTFCREHFSRHKQEEVFKEKVTVLKAQRAAVKDELMRIVADTGVKNFQVKSNNASQQSLQIKKTHYFNYRPPTEDVLQGASIKWDFVNDSSSLLSAPHQQAAAQS